MKIPEIRYLLFSCVKYWFSFDFWGIMVMIMIMIRMIRNNIVIIIKTIRESIATKQILVPNNFINYDWCYSTCIFSTVIKYLPYRTYCDCVISTATVLKIPLRSLCQQAFIYFKPVNRTTRELMWTILKWPICWNKNWRVYRHFSLSSAEFRWRVMYVR